MKAAGPAIALAGYAALALLCVATLRHFEPVRVTGGSMQPALAAGDLVLVDRAVTPGIGDIALLRVRGHGPVLHRVVGIDEDGPSGDEGRREPDRRRASGRAPRHTRGGGQGRAGRRAARAVATLAGGALHSRLNRTARGDDGEAPTHSLADQRKAPRWWKGQTADGEGGSLQQPRPELRSGITGERTVGKPDPPIRDRPVRRRDTPPAEQVASRGSAQAGQPRWYRGSRLPSLGTTTKGEGRLPCVPTSDRAKGVRRHGSRRGTA